MKKLDRYEDKAEKLAKLVKRELSADIKDMFNFLLFYKPKGNVDKILHCVEVFAFWAILTTLYVRW